MTLMDRLMRAEVYAYQRWVKSGYRSEYWHKLAASLNKRVKNHCEYRGVR